MWTRASAALALALATGGAARAAPARRAAVTTMDHEETITVDFARTRGRRGGAVLSAVAKDAGTLLLKVRLVGGLAGQPGKAGQVFFDVRKALAGRDVGNASELSAEVRVSPELVGDGKRNWQRAHRARLVLEDVAGRRLFLPNRSIVDRPAATDGWLHLSGRPTVEVPMPLGHTDAGFDPKRVARVGVSVDAFNREGEVVDGSIELRSFTIRLFPRVATTPLLRATTAVVAGEAERAKAMEERLRTRCFLAPGGMAVGVNLAWPTARAPNGDDMQLYGRIVDGGTQWWGKYWDLGEEPVETTVRNDFRGIRETFGAGAVVRLWIFGDARTGLGFDAGGFPVGPTERARKNLRRLFDLAAEEKVALIPVLFDFGLADGVSKSGPNGAWVTGERPELITDPARRDRLMGVVEALVRDLAGHPATLAWEPMNEPENAVAVVTPEHFAALQRFLRDMVDAIHRAGELATVGHRNGIEPALFRGVVASDLGQAHYYPFLETRPNPSPFGLGFGKLFGPLPSGWGELQLGPGTAARQMRAAQKAGHRLWLPWSWRGHMPSGDGFAVQTYADEIRAALRAGAAGPRTAEQDAGLAK